VGFIELFHEFITFLTSDQVSSPIIYQDSTSVITLVTQGGGVTRTRHLHNRMHLVKEAVDAKKINIRHCKTQEMIADGFTRPLDTFIVQCSPVDFCQNGKCAMLQ
jgi:hypothetical protein